MKSRGSSSAAPRRGARELPLRLARYGARSGLALRIVVLNPPDGVLFRVQRGRTDLENPDLHPAILATRREIVFDFTVRVGPRTPGQPPNFLGAFVQGPRGGRFVYVNSGTLAGQKDSRWSRRAKILLDAITWKQIERVSAKPNQVLEAAFLGTDGCGGPACATVPLVRGWKLTRIRR